MPAEARPGCARKRATGVSMASNLSQFQRHQLEVIARVTPHAMLAHLLNTTVMAVAVAGSIPTAQLIIWCVYSYAIALVLLYRHVRSRGRAPRSFQRGANRTTLYAFLLALPWSSMAALHLGSLAHDQELILLALGVGMAASGTILLSAVPAAAIAYMSGILIPSAVKCLLFLNQQGYVLLGVLAVSYWWFLAALIAKITREISERKRADTALLESEVRYRALYENNPSMYFILDPAGTVLSANKFGAQQLGCTVAELVGQSMLQVVHEDDREVALQQLALCAKDPATVAKGEIRKVRQDQSILWVRLVARAVPDPEGQIVFLIVCEDITERKRAEERQSLLVAELDHRVKNVLASVAAVAQRAREGSGSMDEFLEVFDGRIQSMAKVHGLLSRSRWHGVSLADLVRNELAPCVGEGNAIMEGPEVLISAQAIQPMGIVLHELVTNASKYGALATPRGRISVRWSRRRDSDWLGWLRLEWTETGGPPVVAPTQWGYGTRVIRNLIPYELGGVVNLAFAADGVRCAIEIHPKWIDGRSASGDDIFNVPGSVPLPGAGSSAALPR